MSSKSPSSGSYAGRLMGVWQTVDSGVQRRLLSLLLSIGLFNLIVWGTLVILSARYSLLIGLAPLAYGFGLRHAVDPDHLAAIDNTTRKLMQDGRRPVAVGFFFSLGHSTIVVALSILIALSAAYVRSALPGLRDFGAVVGTSLSGFFLLVIAAINLAVFIDLFRTWRGVTRGQAVDTGALTDYLQNRGLLARLFRPILAAVSGSEGMYVVGLLFGLGFDTASEVGILGLSATSGAGHMPVGFILILPLLFVAGMTLIDTLDGIAMLGAYGWAYVRPIRTLYYNLNITFISVLIAFVIGGLELMNVIGKQMNQTGGLWSWVNTAPYGQMGYLIMTIFLGSWLISVLMYKLRHLNRWDDEMVHVSPEGPHR